MTRDPHADALEELREARSMLALTSAEHQAAIERRDNAIRHLHRVYGYSARRIAEVAGISYSRVARILRT